MPPKIPYDPSLVLGSVIDANTLGILSDMAKVEAKVDAAQESLNAVLASKKSLENTRSELENLGLDAQALNEALQELFPDIAAAGQRYGEERIAAERTLRDLRTQLGSARNSFESPVDLSRSHAKLMPLASDSLALDMEYFAFDPNQMDSRSHASTISSLVSSSTVWLGAQASSETANAVQRQVLQQASTQSIAGTLVVVASCTHKMSSVLVPVVLDIDKAIKTWNKLFPDDTLNATDELGMQSLVAIPDEGEGNHFSIVTGMKLGSAFVGMAHLLNNTGSGTASEDIASLPNRLKESRLGDDDANIALINDFMKRLSAQRLSSNINVVSMGTIPSMIPNELKVDVESHYGAGTKKVSAAGMLGDGYDKLPGLGSLMTALDNYLAKAADGNSGIPVGYFQEDITKKHLVELLLAKLGKSREVPIS